MTPAAARGPAAAGDASWLAGVTIDQRPSTPPLPMGESSYEVIGDIAWFRASGEQDFVDGVNRITDAIIRTKALGLAKLLADITDISGVKPPSVDMRFWLMGEWAKAGRGHVRLALVTRREFMSEDRFGVAFGMNMGFISNLFETREQALQWLSDAAMDDTPPG